MDRDKSWLKIAFDPFDKAPMLIQADWMEERGDLANAEVLRGLSAAGYASLAILSCMLSAEPSGSPH